MQSKAEVKSRVGRLGNDCPEVQHLKLLFGSVDVRVVIPGQLVSALLTPQD
jgi:hypothetical protein